MDELTTSEMARRLRELMVSETISLRAAVERNGWDYNAVYRRLAADGWRLRTTLVKVRRSPTPVPTPEASR